MIIDKTRSLLASAAAAALLAGLPAAPALAQPSEIPAVPQVEASEEQSETDRLNAWFDAVEEQDLDRSPMRKAYRGIVDEDYGDWDEYSDARSVDEFRMGEERLAYMRQNFDYDALNGDARLSWRLFVENQAIAQANFPYRRHGYVFNQMRGSHSQIPVIMTTIHNVASEETAEYWIERANGVPGFLAPQIDEAETRAEMGVYAPVWVYDHVIETARNVISGAPFDDGETNIVLAGFEESLGELDIEDSERERLMGEAEEALLSWVEPYERLISVMEAHKAEAPGGDGVWRLPDGPGYYASQLQNFTTTDLTAEEIHQLGLDEVERIHGEMREIMETVEFDGSLDEFFVFMREDDQFYYATDAEGRERYLEEAAALIDTMEGELSDWFITLPEQELEVRRVEEFRERSAGKAFYSRPAADGSRPGIYYANLYDMDDMPIYQMEALAYHEGIPGHHMQLSIMQDLENIPDFRRFGGYTAYSEGWGLYTEYLPKEMGFYEDPYSDFGRLAMELWRAGRLVVDTGLHHYGWSREEAIDYLVENTPNSRGDSTRSIERYIVMPGQATAYLIGKIEILELREMARDELGEDFDIREFHETVLQNGAVPLTVLEELVNEWIAEKTGEPVQ